MSPDAAVLSTPPPLAEEAPPAPSVVRPDRRTILQLSLLAECHWKTARRALVEGVDSIKGEPLRERLHRGIATIAGRGAR